MQATTNDIVLGDNCGNATALHELGHTLGLLHEHTRPDRDKFILVNDSGVHNGRSTRNCILGMPFPGRNSPSSVPRA